MCLWTVPANYTAFLVKMSLSTGTATNTPAILNAALVVRPYGEVFQAKERFTLTDGIHDQLYVYPTPFNEKSDIEMRAFSSSGSVSFDVSSSLEFVYIKNDSLIMPCNRPRRTPSHPKKSHVVKACEGGKEKIIRFGQQGKKVGTLSGTAGKRKTGESARMKAKRKSFKARHAKNIKRGKMSAAYWADKVKW
jgi:hypothetical protein